LNDAATAAIVVVTVKAEALDICVPAIPRIFPARRRLPMRFIVSSAVAALLILFGLWQATVAEASVVELKKIDKNVFLLDAKLESGVRFQDIPVRKRRLVASWAIELDSPEKSFETITADQLKELIDISLAPLQEKGIYPTHIHIGLGLVDEYKNLAVSAVRQAQCNIILAEHKNTCLNHEVQAVLQRAVLTQHICEIIERNGARCSEYTVGMSEIAVSPEFFGKPWDEVVSSSDAGINMPRMWFSINIEYNEPE